MKEFIDGETQASVERLIEGNARCRHLKKIAACVYLSEAPPPYTLYTCIQYCILNHAEKGGWGVEMNRREG
jgi:hypothetical protein